MAPGLYIPLRSSSSTSSRARALPPHPISSSSSRHRQAAAAASTSTLQTVQTAAPLPFPAFHASSRSILVPAATTASAHRHKNVEYKEGRIEATAARLHANASLNYSSSGSLHLEYAGKQYDPSSACLAEMVHEFLEEEEGKEQEEEGADISPSAAATSACGRARCNCVDGVCGDEFCAAADDQLQEDDESIMAQVEILEGYMSSTSTYISKAEWLLRSEVEKAIQVLTARDDGAIKDDDSVRTNVLGRQVMMFLREAGYNAAACKSRWNHGNGLPAGDYEYIDVLLDGNCIKDGVLQERPAPSAPSTAPPHRVIVDIDFRAQFEIVRPSSEYMRLLDVVPKVFVGRVEKVRQVVRMMSQAAKRSLKACGLMVPPWRKQKYMEAKWLSPIYRRTKKAEAASISASSMSSRMSKTKTRAVKEEENDEDKYDGKGYRERINAIIHGELYKIRPLQQKSEDGRQACYGLCTSWQLPVLELSCDSRTRERAAAAGPMHALRPVSALSRAFQAAEQVSINLHAVGVFS